MNDRLNLERYARDHHAELLAEAEKARLVKEVLSSETSHSEPRPGDVEHRLRSILTAMASYVFDILS